jgi:hypothetical protein
MRQFERWCTSTYLRSLVSDQRISDDHDLYYTIFLPGVVLHELSYWLMAGLLDVLWCAIMAGKAGHWRQAQLRRAVHEVWIKVAIITLPLVTGIIPCG